MPEGIRPTERTSSLNEEETHALLAERGIQHLSPDAWKPHQPLLYVLDEGVRFNVEKDGKTPIPSERIPSIALLSDPVSMKPKLIDRSDPDLDILEIVNLRGQVDFFAINPVTRVPELVGTSTPLKIGDNAFLATRKNLYVADDSMFRKSAPKAAKPDKQL